MPEQNLKGFFEAIDKMSGPLRAMLVQLDGFDKAAKAAGRTMRNFAAIGSVSFGALGAGKKGTEAMERFASAAEPLAEARTHFEQVVGAINLTRANADALALSQKYRQASWQGELETITRAYQLYGNYADALRAVDATSRLAAATNQDVGETLNALAISARNAGVPVEQMADAMARLSQFKQGGQLAAAARLRQLERGFALAQKQGVDLATFLGTVTAVEHAMGAEAERDIFTYFEQTRSGHYGQRAEAVHRAVEQHKAEIAAMVAALRVSRGAAAALLEPALADPAQQLRIAEARRATAAQAFGRGALGLHSRIATAIGDLEGYAAKLMAAHPEITATLSATTLLGAEVVKLAGVTGGAVLSVRTLPSAINALGLSAAANAGELGAGAAGGEAAAAGGAAAASKLGSFAGKLAPVLGAIGALAAFDKATGAKLEPSRVDTLVSEKLAAYNKRGAAVNVHIEHHAPAVNIEVHGADADPHTIAEQVKQALDTRDAELHRKIKDAVDDVNKRDARTEWGFGTFGG